MSKEPDRRYGDADSPVDALEEVVEAQENRRKYWTWCFWAGVGLAPLAALLLVLGQGVTPLRAAAVLAVLAVVLIGLSVTFRDDPSSVRDELTDELRHELDQVRTDLATLRRGVELTVHRELDRVRGELEMARTVLHTEATRLPEYDGGHYEYAEVNYESTTNGRVYGRGGDEYARRDDADRGDYFEPQEPPSQRVEAGASRPSKARGTTYGGTTYGGTTYGSGRSGRDYDGDPAYDTGDYFPDVQTVEPIREEYDRTVPPATSHPRAAETRLLPPATDENYPNATVYGSRRPEAAIEETQWDTPAVADDAYPPSVPKAAAATFAAGPPFNTPQQSVNHVVPSAGLNDVSQGEAAAAFVAKDYEQGLAADPLDRERAVPVYDGDAFGNAAVSAAAQQADRISEAAVYGTRRSVADESGTYNSLVDPSWGGWRGNDQSTPNPLASDWSNPISASPFPADSDDGFSREGDDPFSRKSELFAGENLDEARDSFFGESITADSGSSRAGRHSAPSDDMDAFWNR